MIAAGQPVLVRVSPGWDAAVAYELADGSPVTVWDAEQTAPDGSLWYPIDGGFVPADAVTSAATGGTDATPRPMPRRPRTRRRISATGNDALRSRCRGARCRGAEMPSGRHRRRPGDRRGSG